MNTENPSAVTISFTPQTHRKEFDLIQSYLSSVASNCNSRKDLNHIARCILRDIFSDMQLHLAELALSTRRSSNS